MSIVSTLGQLSGAPPPPASEGARCESRGHVLSFPGKHTRFAMAGPHWPRLWAFTLAVSPSGRFSHSLQVPAQMSVYHVKPQTAGFVHYASSCTPRPKTLVVPLFCFILPCIYHHAYRCLAHMRVHTDTHTCKYSFCNCANARQSSNRGRELGTGMPGSGTAGAWRRARTAWQGGRRAGAMREEGGRPGPEVGAGGGRRDTGSLSALSWSFLLTHSAA